MQATNNISGNVHAIRQVCISQVTTLEQLAIEVQELKLQDQKQEKKIEEQRKELDGVKTELQDHKKLHKTHEDVCCKKYHQNIWLRI